MFHSMNDITFTEVFLCDVTGLGYSYVTGDRLLCQGFNSTMDATHVDLAATWKRKMWSNTLSTEENLRPFSVPYGVCFGESRVGCVCVSVRVGSCSAFGPFLGPPLSACIPHLNRR